MPSLIGNKINQVPTNGDLGTLAFQDSNAVNITGGTVDVSAGTAALPTLGTTGDPNTGVFFPAADTVAVATNGVERVRADASGNLLVGITSATSGGAKLQTVDGITFPTTQVASANANTLDDYEEGTWTPVIAGNTTAGVGTYTVQAGSYTKIGNRVFFNGWVVWTAHTGTGSTYVDGLPFTVANSNNAYGSVSLTSTVAITLTAGNVLQARTSVNVAQFLLLQAPTGGATPVVVPMSTAGGFMVSGHYTIT